MPSGQLLCSSRKQLEWYKILLLSRREAHKNTINGPQGPTHIATHICSCNMYMYIYMFKHTHTP
jgi:hypothetical protein